MLLKTAKIKKEKIALWILLKAMKKGKGDFYGDDYNPIQSEYLDETSRAGLYRSWLEKGEQDGERRKWKVKADAESTGYFLSAKPNNCFFWNIGTNAAGAATYFAYIKTCLEKYFLKHPERCIEKLEEKL